MLRRVIALLQTPPAYLVAAGLVVVTMTAISILFGYLSPDSWFYILIAQGLRSGHGCSLHGAYLGVYPCGYPAALALTAPATDTATLMLSSKITNLILLVADFWLIWKASRQILVATVVALNPVTLMIALYTWSENLELFCMCGAIYALTRLDTESPPWRDRGLLALVLTVGCFTRYFFGPFAFLLFLATWLSHGRRVAFRALPSFAVAGLFYIGYQSFNLLMSGYTTGMPRVPAPETPYYLFNTFIGAFWHDAWNMLVALGLLLGLGWPLIGLRRSRPAPDRHAAAMLILLAGVAFLGLAIILRARTLFDPYDTRTTGFGLVFIAAGLTGRFVRLKDDARWPAWAVLASGLFSVIYCDDNSIPLTLPTLGTSHWALASAHVPDLVYRGPKPAVMVTFDIPEAPDRFGNVETTKPLYYGDTILISPALAPDVPPDTPKTLLAKLDIVGDRSCAFDFTAFPTLADFQAYLDSTTPVDQSFTLGGTPSVTSKPNWDPTLQRYLMAVVQPGKLVPCRQILDLPVTRAALVGQTETLAQAVKAERLFLNH
jgi:hypothetical protein